jgi:hypothetical protein
MVLGTVGQSFAQDKKDKSSLISVTLKVKTADGIQYSNAKIWDATSRPIIDTQHRTNKNGEVTLKVLPSATLYIGEYMIWESATNEYIPIEDVFPDDGKDYYTIVEVNGRRDISVVVKQV